MRDMLFRLRHRKSRSEVIAFAMGMKVGRELVLIMGPEATKAVADKVVAELEEDYA